jgi:hypothetical protein
VAPLPVDVHPDAASSPNLEAKVHFVGFLEGARLSLVHHFADQPLDGLCGQDGIFSGQRLDDGMLPHHRHLVGLDQNIRRVFFISYADELVKGDFV